MNACPRGLFAAIVLMTFGACAGMQEGTALCALEGCNEAPFDERETPEGVEPESEPGPIDSTRPPYEGPPESNSPSMTWDEFVDAGYQVPPEMMGPTEPNAAVPAEPIPHVDAGITRLEVVVGKLGGAGYADGEGALARFHQPAGMVERTPGVLMVADTWNYRIRNVQLSNGVVTSASSSAYWNDLSPHQYINNDLVYAASTEVGSHSVNLAVPSSVGVARIILTGKPTEAGAVDGSLSAARFNFPEGVVSDRNGVIYVADTSNHTVRKVDRAANQVSTLVGRAGVLGYANGTGGGARFRSPNDLVLDDSGNLYVAELYNCAIRKVVLATGAVSTLAGAGPNACGVLDGTGTRARFARPERLEYHPAQNLLYVLDQGNLRTVGLANGEVKTLVTAGTGTYPDGPFGSARLHPGQGHLLLATDGHLYVSDASHTIRRIDVTAQTVTTVAGKSLNDGQQDGPASDAGLKGVNGKAIFDNNGSILFSDDHKLRRLNFSTGVVSTIAGGDVPGAVNGTGAVARFHNPHGFSIANDGFLYVADRSNHAIRKVNLATNAVTLVAGRLGVSGFVDSRGGYARFNNPRDVVALGDSLYIADSGNCRIRKMLLSTGAVTTLAGQAPNVTTGQCIRLDGTGASASFERQTALATIDGLLYVMDGGALRRVDPSTGETTTLISNTGADSYTAWLTPIGRELLIAQRSPGLARINLATLATTLVFRASGAQRRVDLAPASMACPTGMAVSPTGDTFVLDACENLLVRVLPP